MDVSLYSSAITELHVHRRDALERFFGGRFGYLSSGTHEIEAIAYAKQQAERVTEERKIIVVTTDGQPNSVALSRTGAKDLRTYYRGTLNPWLRESGIDLLAIGIGSSPATTRTRSPSRRAGIPWPCSCACWTTSSPERARATRSSGGSATPDAPRSAGQVRPGAGRRESRSG